MNSIPGREPRPDRSRYPSTQRNPQKGLLLGTDFRHAVEFSRSGRAENRPFRASSLAALSHRTPIADRCTRGCSDGPHGLARRNTDEDTRGSRSAAREVGDPVTPGSGDPGRTELHADSRPDRPGRLWYAVLPRPLAGAAHDDE